MVGVRECLVWLIGGKGKRFETETRGSYILILLKLCLCFFSDFLWFFWMLRCYFFLESLLQIILVSQEMIPK